MKKKQINIFLVFNMKNKKHSKIVKDYDKQKSRHLEKLASKTLANDDKFRKLQDKKVKGKFLDLF